LREIPSSRAASPFRLPVARRASSMALFSREWTLSARETAPEGWRDPRTEAGRGAVNSCQAVLEDCPGHQLAGAAFARKEDGGIHGGGSGDGLEDRALPLFLQSPKGNMIIGPQ